MERRGLGMKISVDLSKVSDPMVRKALRDIQEAINGIEFISAQYKMLDVTINAANSALEIPHSLGFLPTDIIVTKSSGDAYSFIYEKFTDKVILINATGPANIRLYLGRNIGVVPIGTN
jgi:hypothetical protein